MNSKKNNWDLDKDERLIQAIKPRQCLYDMGSALYSDINAKKKAWIEIGSLLRVDASACKERWESLRSQFRKHLNKKKSKSGQAAKKLIKWRLEEQMLFLTPFICNDRQRSTSVKNEENYEDEDGGDGEDRDDSEDGEDGEEKERIDNDSDITTNINNAIDIQAIQRNKARKEQSNNSNRRVVKITKLKKKTSVDNDSRQTASSTLMKYLIQQHGQPKEQRKEHNNSHPMDTFFSLMASTVKNFNPADQHAIKTKIFLLVNEMEEKYISQIHNYPIHQHPQLTTPMPSPSPASSVYSSVSSLAYT